MCTTFSTMIHRGWSASAKRVTSNAVRRLVSERGALPFAHVWLVHSGEAMMRSTLPILRFSFSIATASHRSSRCRTSGKLSSYVFAARVQLSTAATSVAPAAAAPALLPPAPEKRSIARITRNGFGVPSSFVSSDCVSNPFCWQGSAVCVIPRLLLLQDFC